MKLRKNNFFSQIKLGLNWYLPNTLCQNDQILAEENAFEMFLASWVAKDTASEKFEPV